MASVTATINPSPSFFRTHSSWVASIVFPGSTLNVPVNNTLGQNFVADRLYNPSTWENSFPSTASLETGIQSVDADYEAIRFTCNNTGNSRLRISIPPFTPNGTDTYIVSFWARHVFGSKNGCVSSLSGDASLNKDYGNDLTGEWKKISYSGVPSASSKTFLDLFASADTDNIIDFWGVQVERSISSRILVSTPGPSEMTLSASTASFGSYGGPYISWRDRTLSSEQFPTVGKSLDIWSDTLCSAVNSGATYQNLVTTGTYALNPDKWTVFYNYNVPYGSHYGKGGTITFTTP